MKTLAFAAALLLGGAAFAQTDEAATGAYDGDGMASAGFETEGAASPARMSDLAAAVEAGAVVQPGNSAPERDARGIAVVSDPAVAPAGWNGTPATAMGGPLLDPATGEAAEAEAYPACSATVTDNCLQTYERRRS